MSKVRGFKCKKLGHYANKSKNEKNSSGNEKHVTFAMMCCENSEEEKYENGEEENKPESKNPDEDPGTARNTEEPQGIPLVQLYISNIFSAGIMSEWAMSMIEDNLATPKYLSSVQAWRESSNHGQEEEVEI